MALALPVAAQTDDASRGAARDLATAGVEAFQRDAFADASAKLEKAYRILKVPSVGLWSARALAKLGQLVKASERYHEVGLMTLGEGEAAVQKQAQADAQSELDALTPRIPRVVIKLSGAGADDAVVKVDGGVVSSALIGESRPIDPGKHLIEATRAGQSAKSEIVLAEGETKETLLTLQPGSTTPSTAPAPAAALSGPASAPADRASGGLGAQRAVALVVGGVGVVGLGVGSVFGLRAKSKLDEANSSGCSGSTCANQVALDANDAARSAGTVSTICFAVGGALLAGGAVLWLTGAPERTATASLGVGVGSLQLRTVW